MVINRPSGSSPLKKRRASDSLITTTRGETALSRLSKSRPRASCIPVVRKYPGETVLKYTVERPGASGTALPSMATL
jgi:hypothetical protein